MSDAWDVPTPKPCGFLRLSFRDSLVLSDNLDLGVQVDVAFALRPFLDVCDEGEHILRAGTSIIHDEVAMNLGNFSSAEASAFQAEFLDQFPGRNGCRVLEDTTR